MAESFSTSVLLTDIALKDCYLKGWLIGPNEDEKKFMGRKNAMALLSNLKSEESIHGFRPEGLPVFFSRKKLFPWQAAAVFSGPAQAVLSMLSITSPDHSLDEHVAFIQMQPALKKGSYLFYSKKEILDHEMVHFFRSAFEEKRYEEILAYRTSSSFFRKFFGPIFSSTSESALLIGLLLATCLSLYIWGLIAGFLVLANLRLYMRQKVMQKCLTSLHEIAGKRADSLVLSLTDLEIERFAKMSKQQILKEAQEDKSLRWRQLKAVYRDFL